MLKNLDSRGGGGISWGTLFDRELAQLVERHPYKVDVAGSTPVLPTNLVEITEQIKIGNW